MTQGPVNTVVPLQRAAHRPEWVFAGVVILSVALYFVCAATWSFLRQARAHAAFVPVSARVVEASVRARGSSGASGGTSYLPHVVYRYSVKGRDFLSDRYFYAGDGWSDAASAQVALAGLRAGDEVQAFVDVDDPTQSVLDVRAPRWEMLAMTLPFTLLGLGALVYGLRRRPGRLS
jgi:hypothetical protein